MTLAQKNDLIDSVCGKIDALEKSRLAFGEVMDYFQWITPNPARLATDYQTTGTYAQISLDYLWQALNDLKALHEEIKLLSAEDTPGERSGINENQPA